MSGGVQARFDEELAAGRFAIQRCSACTHHVFYPRQVCPHCGRPDRLEWVEPSGYGTIHSTTTVRIDPKAPHDVCLVDLDEGVRMMGAVHGLDPGRMKIGTRVKLLVLPAAEGRPAMIAFEVIAA